MTKMKLALHIGTEKTGTTLLQEWLYHNSSRLSQQGYFLSKKIEFPCNRKLVAFFREAPDDYWNFHALRSKEEKERFFEGFLQEFETELREAETSHHTTIISAEHFHSRLNAPEDLAAFAEFCKRNFRETKVICYLRSQWAVRQSLYSTGVKLHKTVPLSEFDAEIKEDNLYYNYYNLYRRWGSNFGFENLDFRKYDRKNFEKGDLRLDFLKAMGGDIDASVLDFSITSANESVKLLRAAAMIGTNKAIPLFPPHGVDKRNYYYKSIVNQIDALNVGEIIDDLAQEIADTFRDSNARLAREALGREELFSEPEQKQAAERVFSAQEVADIVEQVAFAYTQRTSSRLLFDGDADVLRDVALKYQNGKPVTREDALALMSLAGRARPNGALIQKKLNEWRQDD
ncbi:hypothetical protein JT55_02730 [Rhodovulum sp. NI22]|nr:hypothetical protein JT55_02730 [Rhodovulum sp. NI22]